MGSVLKRIKPHQKDAVLNEFSAALLMIKVK